MSEHHRHIAHSVVEAFKESLNEPALRAITGDEFEELEILILEAIADELHDAAEQMEQVARRLRSEAETPELGL